MKTVRRSSWLLLLLTSTFACAGSAPERVAVVLQGDSTGTRFVQQMVDRDPRVADPHSRKEFFIQVVKPDPKADYRIVQVRPDPKVKYFLRVLNPEGKGEDVAMNAKLSAALQARMEAAGVGPK